MIKFLAESIKKFCPFFVSFQRQFNFHFRDEFLCGLEWNSSLAFQTLKRDLIEFQFKDFNVLKVSVQSMRDFCEMGHKEMSTI